eukprot:PhF_6_TR9249/c0_g1_i2/m.14635/K03754/EIF2B2; translation initiation factor eIF-2B subunit beta
MDLVDKFLIDVKRNAFKGTKDLSPSLHVAESAARTLREILSKLKQDMNVREVLSTLRKYAKELSKAPKYGPLIANVARRVLWIVRDEYNKAINPEANPSDPSDSIPTQGSTPNQSPYIKPAVPCPDDVILMNPDLCRLDPLGEEKSMKWGSLKTAALRALTEYIEQFSNTQAALCKQAEQHIREGEMLLTYGHSSTIESFLKAAAQKRKFTVIIAQSSPSSAGVTLAKALKESDEKKNVQVRLVSDASIFAVMPDVGKVIIGTQLVLANGGILAEAGAHMVSIAAKHYNVPVLAIAASEKFCPYFPVDRCCSAVVKLMDVGDHPWSNEGNPHGVVQFAEAGRLGVHVVSAVSDYVDPELVTLFITNEDSFASSLVYRVIAESYNPEDADI